jgi:2-polyprenyl-3-methyl-5-hydroxy-6-metoxy-1,4-benzoquinol methylase
MDKTKIAVGVFNKLAKEYQEKFMDVERYSDTFDFFCHLIETKNAQILELACGPGNITKYVLQKRPDFKILGTDLAPNMIALAKINNPKAAFQIMDCRDINTITKKYDGIICGFCLPYLSKEAALQLIQDASKIIKSGGVFYVSTMEEEYSKSGFQKGSGGDEIFMHYHQADYLRKAFEEHDFTIRNLQRKDFLNHDGIIGIDLIIIAQKG